MAPRTKKGTTSESTTAVAIPVANPIEMIANIDAQLAAIGNVHNESWKTGTNSIAGMVIKDSKDIAGLVKLAGLVHTQREQYVIGQGLLQLESIPEFKISGCSYDEIVNDIQKQVNILTYSEKVKELEALKNEWKEFITKEDKKQALIAKMAKAGFEI
jgi:hypothetical protein